MTQIDRAFKIAISNGNGLTKYSKEIKTFILSQTFCLFLKHTLQTRVTPIFLGIHYVA